MNKELEQLYAQYSQVNDISRDVFLNSYEQFGDTYINFIQESLKKKENSQETPSSSSGLGENQPTPTSAQGNPQITSVPISQDLDLNQAQIEAMQGVQNPASLNLELPQQSVNQNGLLESNGEVNTSSSVLEDSFNNFIQKGGQLPLNPTSTRLNVLPRAYEEQFNNVTESAPQVSEYENINTTNNDFVDFGNGITLPKELLPEEKTKDEFNKEIAESAKDVTLKQSGKLETFDIENPKWISRNIGDLQGENYVNDILQKEKEGKVKVARNENGELIDKDLKPILDNSNVLWQPVGTYINDYNNDVNKFNKEIELNNQKISQNNALIESQNIRDLFLGKKEEPKSPLTTLYNKIYSDTGILLTEEQKAQFNTIDDVYNFYASEKAKKEVQKNPSLNYNEEYNKLINELNPKIDAQQSLQLGKNFVNNFLLGFRIEEEKSFNEARGYGAKIDTSYQKGYNSKDDLQEINFIKNLSNNQYGLGLIGEWWNAVGKKEIGTTNYKINATLSTPEGRADVINSIANYINGRGSIKKELAYENIQREKFNNQKNAKEGNVLALQDSINFIQSESNKINQIDKQQKEIYDFIDSWKKTQIRNNKKEQEFARTYSGYQSGEILPSIKIIAGNTVNGISDAVKSTIAGVTLLPNLIIGSDEYNDVISEIKKPSEFFGVKTSGMLSKYYDYKSGGKDIRFQNGNYYELVNGDYRPINLTYAQISNLGKAKEGEEFSIAGMIGDTTRMATEMGLAEFTGTVALKGLSKFSQIRNIERVSSVFGEESALTNSLQRLERFSKNPTNNGYFGWYTQTIADNYLEAKAKGMTNTQAAIYGSIQSLLTSFLSRINPDVKFFKIYKDIDEKLIGSLLKNDKQGFLNNVKSLSNHVGGEITSETGQELTERFAQELVRQFYNTSLTDKKFDTMTADDVLKTVITTAITTGALTSSNLALRGSGDNIINYDNAYYNSTQLSEGQKLVMLANLNTSEIFKNFNNQFISDKNKLNEIEQTVKSVKTYLDKIPNKDKYTLNTQTKAVSLLYEIDQKRKQLNNVDESFKDDINNEINDLTDNLKQLLNDDLKLQNEQPQQTTQPEQTQETAQGQTTETNLQSEQGTATTEQGVSADVDRKEVYAQDIANGNVVSFVYENEEEVPSVFKDRITSDSLINGKRTIRVSMSKSEAEDLLKNNNQTLPTNETEQTTQSQQSDVVNAQSPEITTNQTDETTLSEEEQVKINLERLNAYIEAKKQRERELEYNKPEIEQQLVGDLVDLRVEYNGEIGVIKKDEGGKLTFENDNTIIELDGTENAKEYQPQYISYRNGEVLIGDKKYEYVSTNENNNGDVVSVTLTNEKGKNITIRDTDTALAIDRAKSNIYFQSNTNKITEQEELKVVKVELQNEWGGLALGIIESIPDEVLDTFISLESGIVALAPNELQLMTANASQWADDAKKRIEQSKAPKQEKKDAIAMLDKFQKDLNKYYNAIEKQKSKSSNATSKQTSTKQSDKKASTNETKNQVGQPSETQTTPLVSESKSTNGKYTIRVEQNNGIGNAKILDNNGNEVKLTNKQKEKYVAEHFAKQAYPETVVEDADKLNPSEFNQELVNTSNNPLELAQILDTESEFIPSDLLDAKENAIANVIGKKVSRSSFIQFDDANNISFSIARGYGLTNKGKTIDVIAQEAEVLIYGDWDSQNPRVTTEDVINFMKKYNNGADTFFRQPNPTYRDAAGKFEKITGIKATKNALDVLLGKKTATKIDFAKLQEEADLLSAEQAYNLEKEYNEWFNSLSLEDKNLELQKTYPYEQRTEENIRENENESISNNQTESSKNVANQERYGATTEEINQVSPSPQYEGAVTYAQFGEGQEGTIYYEDGVAKIKDKAGKVYNANSPLVKNLKDADGNAIQLQKGNQRLTPITKQAFDALVTKLQKAFPRFAKVTYDFEAFKKQAEKLGATFNDIQRMVMAFHGSPHSFDKFTTDKIGTGEGAQAFGWGLYFTDLESIARNYADKLAQETSFYDASGNKIDYNNLSNAEQFAIIAVTDPKKKYETTLGIAQEDFNDNPMQFNKEYLDAVIKFKGAKKSRGAVYKVSLHKGKTPDQYTWLEWDKNINNNLKEILFNSASEQSLSGDIHNIEISEKFDADSFDGGKTYRVGDTSKIGEKDEFTETIYSNLQDALLEATRLNFLDTTIKGREFYEALAKEMGQQQASLFLLENGIDGIKYPAESLSRGATSDTARGFNYVVFDENAVTIEDKIQFMQTPNGTIYGAKLPDGTIYLNPQFLNANTPIHEFSHLFEQLLPSRFKKGVELLKQTNLGKKLFEQLKQEGNYANLTDEQLWSEALNTHIGNFGENEVNNPKGKLKQLQDWIKDFFAKVGDVLGIKKLSPDTQLRMFTEGVVKDLLGGKPIVAENQVSPSEQVQYSFLTENDYDTNGNIKPEVLAEIQAEREAIKSEAQANGTFMKAPNGKATNLNEAQWVDVRTKRFKDWFGDWENDVENASKVIDENGEPLVVYHGTKDNFNEFDSKKQSNKGFWFTPKKNLADGYSMARNSGEIGNVFSVFLNIKNPANNDWVSKSNPNSEIITNDMVSFDELGYDGWISVIGGKTTSLVALNPNQIKSATSNIGTYSASSNDIRYSINSKTPLSVKEQTEVINELVSNGEESAFAKLQETNWYKVLSNSQKQNINPTNIAETIVNEVNANKRNLEQKVERRDAKIERNLEAIKSVKEVIQQTINDASERGLFKGIASSKVLEYAMRNINKAITPAQQKRVLNTVKKIINDNEYLNKVRNANDLAKRVKKVANSKSISKPLVNVDTAKEFAKINPRNVENIDDYIQLANAIIGNLKGVSVNNKLEVSNKNYGTNNESILKYIEDTAKYNEKIKQEELKADYDELLRTSNLPVKDMSFEEYKDFINLSKLEENAQKFEDESKATQDERTNLLRAVINRRLKNDFETEILANKSEYSSEEQKIINRISKIDTSKLDYKQLVKLNDVINNSIYNNSFMDAGNISLIAQVQENEKAIDDFKVKNNFNFLSLSDNWATRALQGAISNDMLVEFITNSTTASAFLKIKSGISAVMDGHAGAKVIQQKTVNAFINMKKKVGWKSDTTENRNIRGIYAEMLRNNGGTDEEIQSEWDRKKGLIQQTIDGLANSRNKEDNKASELLQKVYDKTLKNANNISELEANISKLEFGKFNIDSVKFWIEQHDKYADDFIEQGNIYNNKNLEKELNYTGRKYRPITEDAQKKQDDTLFNEVYRSTEITYKESGSKTKTVKNKFLPKGLVLDLDFDKVQAKMLYDNLYDLKTAEGISLLKNFLSNPENIDRIGGKRNMEALKNMMRNTILAQKQALPFENDNFAKALDKIAGSVMMKSARLALGSVTQLPKQYLSVLVNTSVNLFTDIPLLFEAYRVSGFRNNLELFDKFNIGLRGSTIAGYNKENAIFADENAGTVDRTKAILYDVNKASKALYDGTMKALELSDVSIARTTWLAFYMKSLKKQGIDITKIDWSKEHENPNQEAAAFAEQTVSRLQNANDASSMADNFKNTNTYAKVFKNLYMPYSTFAVNQRARMTSDMQKIIHGSIDGRAEAFKSLIATIAEQAVFNSFKIYVLGNGAQYLAELFLTGILGWDDEEAEDLFKNAKKYATQKFVTSTVSDIFFSGMGSGTQTGLQLFANKLTKLINGEEYFYDYKNDPEKTGIPNSISALGGYGTSIATFLGLANDMKYLDGEGDEIVKGGGTNNLVMRPKELSKESKQLVYLTFMIDALALAGLGDQYISQINQKIKKARDKKIKDDLGSYFDTRIYIPSSSDNYKNYAKLRIDKKTSISDIKQIAKKEGAYLNEKTFNRKMKDEIFNYKVSKHRDEIEDKLLNYREGKINRDQLRNYVKSLKDLSYDQQVKLWKTFPKDNKK